MTKHLSLAAVAVALLTANFALGDIKNSKHDFSSYGWSDGQICRPCHTPHNAIQQGVTGRLWAHTLSADAVQYTYHSGTTVSSTDGTTRTDAATVKLTNADLDQATRLCLGCHDGTVAVDSFMGNQNAATVSIGSMAVNTYNPNIGGAAIGDTLADLSNDHPVGFKAVYNENYQPRPGYYPYKPLADVVGAGLKLAKTTTDVTAGYTYRTGEVLGTNGLPKYAAPTATKMLSISCVTCHSVHNSGSGSAPSEKGLLSISNASSSLCLTCHHK